MRRQAGRRRGGQPAAAKDKADESEGSVGSGGSAVICRICFTSEDTPFVAPCKCKGTMAVVHIRCLERWLVESGRNSCELCGEPYPTQRELMFSVTDSLRHWFLRRQQIGFVHYTYVRDLRIDVVLSFIFTILLFVATMGCIIGADYYIAAQKRHDWPAANKCTTPALFICALLVTMTYHAWTYSAIRYHFHKWYWWWQHSVHVKLTLPPLNMEEFRKKMQVDKDEPEGPPSTTSPEDQPTTSPSSLDLQNPTDADLPSTSA